MILIPSIQLSTEVRGPGHVALVPMNSVRDSCQSSMENPVALAVRSATGSLSATQVASRTHGARWCHSLAQQPGGQCVAGLQLYAKVVAPAFSFGTVNVTLCVWWYIVKEGDGWSTEAALDSRMQRALLGKT
ncbi:hypothetical protein LMH87_011665 [Akanthomyces muscarius]|uniref:Uncharacterized protein n=1 Tax=Akanthomyces muscarius TaxID=2231603 RepID=A0A9W8QC72_AKAMU|nr:hypothetical protein LMH87_011665 [Akanthomyces muscarius]KAJ4150938.1 hypothetical protein LMH87_011665 [Akanthomyces muscarius]